jgi:hypothetical protein
MPRNVAKRVPQRSILLLIIVIIFVFRGTHDFIFIVVDVTISSPLAGRSCFSSASPCAARRNVEIRPGGEFHVRVKVIQVTVGQSERIDRNVVRGRHLAHRERLLTMPLKCCSFAGAALPG